MFLWDVWMENINNKLIIIMILLLLQKQPLQPYLYNIFLMDIYGHHMVDTVLQLDLSLFYDKNICSSRCHIKIYIICYVVIGAIKAHFKTIIILILYVNKRDHQVMVKQQLLYFFY